MVDLYRTVVIIWKFAATLFDMVLFCINMAMWKKENGVNYLWVQVKIFIGKFYSFIFVWSFGSQVEVESTYLFSTQNKLMDVHQSDISKILHFFASNLVSFIFIKSHHFTEAYLVLLHKTSHTSFILFFFWFPWAGSRESTPSVSSR